MFFFPLQFNSLIKCGSLDSLLSLRKSEALATAVHNTTQKVAVAYVLLDANINGTNTLPIE
jgi:hypothetical protein